MLGLLDTGLSLIPADSTYAQVVRDIVGWNQRYADWRDCFAQIKARYGYDRYGGGCHIIPNAAVIAMALAYSQNDFSRALHISNMAGWDTDCNVGNVGCIMGLVAGLEGIHSAETDWFSDVNDHVLASLILGSECILDIPNAALRIGNLGRAVAGITERRAYKGGANYHWSFPGSTHCWEYEREPGAAAIRQMSNTTYSAHGSRHSDRGSRGLKLVMQRLSSENQGVVYRKTFFTRDDIGHSGYDVGTSPIIYPGQVMTASVYLSVGKGVKASLFVRDYATKRIHRGDEVSLSAKGGAKLVYDLSCPDVGLIDRAGIVFSADQETTAVA